LIPKWINLITMIIPNKTRYGVAPSLPFRIASRISWVCGRAYSLKVAAIYIEIIKIFLTHSSRFFIPLIYPSKAKLPKKKVGRQTGFEPATPGTTNQCSNQLSYYRHKEHLKLIIHTESSMGKVSLAPSHPY
jgi:hypothetical protein